MLERTLVWALSKTVLVVASLVLAFFLPVAVFAALTEPCGLSSPTANGYFFSNYESVTYSPEGYLELHFRNQSRFSDGRGFQVSWSLVSDECVTQSGSSTGMGMPTGLTDWSVRFTSLSHFDLWDDANNTIVASINILPTYPNYYRISFRGSIDGGASVVNSRTFKIYQPGTPPEFPDTAEKSTACPDIAATGYYFDTYERAEYVDGLLRVHVRFKTPFNDGRTFRLSGIGASEPCTFAIPPYLANPDVSVTPQVRYYSFRMTSPTHWVLWDDENDKAFTCPRCEGDISAGSAHVLWYGIIDAGASTMRTTPYPPSSAPPCCSSVLFLPGFQASELYEDVAGTETKRWLPGLLQSSVDGLRMNTDGTPQRQLYTKPSGALQSIPLPILGIELVSVYKTFFAQLDGMKQEGVIADWRAFPYDWRANVESVVADGVLYNDGRRYLVDEVEALASASKSKHVTIVGHSNGGLVAKALMRKLAAEGKSGLVDKVIFVGSPQLGTPKAIASLLHGDEQDVPRGAGVLMLSKGNARALAEYMPGAFGLLPSTEYYARVLDPVVDLTRAEKLRSETGMQAVVDTYTEAQQFMSGNGLRVKPVLNDIESPNNLSSLLLAEAGTTHGRLDTWVPPPNVDVIQIAGWGLDTVKGITYWDEAKTVCPTILTCATATSTRHTVQMTEDGDGTVVSPSATYIGQKKFYVDVFRFNEDTRSRFSHINLTEIPVVQNLIGKIFVATSTPFVLPSYVSSSIPVPSSPEKRLRLKVMSPASLQVCSQEGCTGLFQNPIPGSDLLFKKEEIPNSYYEEFGETKYLGLPSGQYTFSMNGTDTGQFTLEVEKVVGDTAVSETSLVDIPVTPSTKIDFTTDSNSDLSPVRIDKDGDGTTDYVVTPTLGGEVTLPKAPVTVTAHNKSILLGAQLPTFTYGLTGFIAGETLATSDITGVPTCASAATTTSSIGIYPIICTAGTLASNYYKFENFINGSFTISYPWSGFQQPIDDPVAQSGATPSIFKAGSTVPVKFRLRNASGQLVQATVLPQWLPPTKGGALSAPVDEAVYSDPATSGSTYRWDSTSQQYIYNWSTKGFAPGYWYKIYAKLDDGTIKSVTVGLR